MQIKFASGTGSGQAATIIDYVGSTRTVEWSGDMVPGDGTSSYRVNRLEGGPCNWKLYAVATPYPDGTPCAAQDGSAFPGICVQSQCVDPPAAASCNAARTTIAADSARH